MPEHFICITCGVQQAASDRAPHRCPICEDERQYVGWGGQQWTTLAALRRDHRNQWVDEEPGVSSIHTDPAFAIGQRALLIETPAGNVLWDCVSLLDDETLEHVRSRGGIRAIAISHPHYYAAMVEWSRAFANAPIYLHSADRHWVARPDENIHFWSGEMLEPLAGVTLIHTGGHFDGFQVMHWRNLLFSGDQPQVVMDRDWVSFMYSYPNLIPLSAAAVRRVTAALEPFSFDRIYGAFPGRTVREDAKAAVERSASRYLRMIAG